MTRTISNDEVNAIFENGKDVQRNGSNIVEHQVFKAIPTDMKRIIIHVGAFEGAKPLEREEWGENGAFMEKVMGLEFHNPKDDKIQVLKSPDGCIICYDGQGRMEAIKKYLAEKPWALKNAANIGKFIDWLKENVVKQDGKADLWDTDIAFAKGLLDAPKTIKPGTVFAGVKAKEAVEAVFIEAGTVVGGATAGEEGAYLRRSAGGDTNIVQKKEFLAAWEFKDEQKQQAPKTQQAKKFER